MKISAADRREARADRTEEILRETAMTIATSTGKTPERGAALGQEFVDVLRKWRAILATVKVAQLLARAERELERAKRQ